MLLEAKRAQVAAYFLMRRGGTLTIMELVKFMYLADRESLDRYGFPITWDQPYALEHGPVPTETYSCIKGVNGQCGVDWPKLVSPPGGSQNRDINLLADIDIDDLDELSEADLEVLEGIWAKFGGMTAYQLRKWTHENCPEWVDPGKSSKPIQYEEIFRALKKAPDQIPILTQHIKDQVLITRLHTQA
jgi:uncharacterized phage-associated protein